MDYINEIIRKWFSIFYFPFYISLCFTVSPVIFLMDKINKSFTDKISRAWKLSTFIFVKMMFVRNIRLFYNPEILKFQRILLISNHVNNLDWIIIWMSLLSIKRKNIIFTAKNSTCFYGSLFNILNNFTTNFVFLKRNLNYDYITLVESCKEISKLDEFTNVLFPEGTVLCKKKSKFVNFQRALHRDMEIPKKTLVPKTTGFKIMLENLSDKLDGLINCTIIYHDPVSILSFFKGERTCVDIYFDLLEKPKDSYESFLMNVFSEKENLLVNDGFVNKDFLNINISLKKRYKYIMTLALPWIISKIKLKKIF